jgi:hypothetical protein
MKLTLGMSKLKFSLSETHPNKMVITGCLFKIGSPSDGAPCGSDGKKIVFTQQSVMDNYATYDMMPVNCIFPEDFEWSPGTDVFTGHGETNIGVIEKTWIDGEDLMATMIVWKAIFPDISFMTINAKDSLGFSIECFPDETHDGADDGYLYIDKFTGLGAAMLFKNTAAFSGTYIKNLVASLQTNLNIKDDVNMTPDEMKQCMKDAMSEMMQEMVDGMDTKVAASITEVNAEVVKVNAQVEALALNLVEVQAAIIASAVIPVVEPVVEPIVAAVVAPVLPLIPVPTANQIIVANADLNPQVDDSEAKMNEINTSSMSMMEKCKAITKLKLSKKV